MRFAWFDNRLPNIPLMWHGGILVLLAGLVLIAAEAEAWSADGVPATVAATPPRKIDFGRDIQPILARRCFACHGPNKAEAGLRLNDRDAAMARLDSGQQAIVPSIIDQSQLLRRIAASDDDQRMPPDGKPLAPEQIELMRQWIAEGAVWGGHWAFQPVRAVPPPPVKLETWVQGDIDRFILSRLEQSGLAPAPPAEKSGAVAPRLFRPDRTAADSGPTRCVSERCLARRLRAGDRLVAGLSALRRTLGATLAGRGPICRHQQLRARRREAACLAISRLRHPLAERRQALRSVPARDNWPATSCREATADSIIATGFYRLGVWDDEPADRMQARYEELDDIVTTTGQAVMGLTLNCARCHDHKIDPLTQRDYYQYDRIFSGPARHGDQGPRSGNANLRRPW